ncbi:hypothetical protein [Kingella sp. (in: b-proteobacteria)]|nr:hypothetical protein [Kingella sp. (in: b-proteobacteria)]MDO4657250.1 hypothetical protein [Kingella sp. (in: b-proteobacteria)]
MMGSRKQWGSLKSEWSGNGSSPKGVLDGAMGVDKWLLNQPRFQAAKL